MSFGFVANKMGVAGMEINRREFHVTLGALAAGLTGAGAAAGPRTADRR